MHDLDTFGAPHDPEPLTGTVIPTPAELAAHHTRIDARLADALATVGLRMVEARPGIHKGPIRVGLEGIAPELLPHVFDVLQERGWHVRPEPVRQTVTLLSASQASIAAIVRGDPR